MAWVEGENWRENQEVVVRAELESVAVGLEHLTAEVD